MDAAQKYKKKKDNQNRTKIEEIASIFVLDLWWEFIDMIIQGAMAQSTGTRPP